jgi:hypothetical protein
MFRINNRKSCRTMEEELAFDLGHVDKPGSTADKRTTRESQFGDRLRAAFIQGATAVSETFAALENRSEDRMMFQTLLENRQLTFEKTKCLIDIPETRGKD